MISHAINNVYVADEHIDIYKYPDLDQKHLAQKKAEITVYRGTY